ncbi:flavodoxin family protein [Lentzea jiangxiensis]|uniref:flavodoxin family protein n=1 Tax=Lentzea jiangxiensis TaxID=641025 RepID=UPI000B7C8A91|nr:NAD(P)H-dependent oxidoreductase [Lentzea jiangxiensis]
MERSVNVTVVYYSSTGTIHRLAEEISETAEKQGAEVRLVRAAELAPRHAVDSRPAWAAHLRDTEDVPVASAGDVLWADAVLFGTPTRFGNVSAQLKQFIDTLGPAWSGGLLADKVYSAFTSGASTHGGMETTLVSIYNMACHFGGIIVPPGGDLNPYGTSHVLGADNAPVGDRALRAAQLQAERVVRVARALKEV